MVITDSCPCFSVLSRPVLLSGSGWIGSLVDRVHTIRPPCPKSNRKQVATTCQSKTSLRKSLKTQKLHLGSTHLVLKTRVLLSGHEAIEESGNLWWTCWDYSFHIMFWRQFEMLPLGIASKLGLHPFTYDILVTVVSTSPPKQPPAGPWQLKIVEICNGLVGLC